MKKTDSFYLRLPALTSIFVFLAINGATASFCRVIHSDTQGSEQYRFKVEIKRIYIRIKLQLPLLLPTWQSSQPFLSYCSHHQRQTFIHHGALLLRSLITTSVQMRSVCGSVKIACSRVNGKEVFCL